MLKKSNDKMLSSFWVGVVTNKQKDTDENSLDLILFEAGENNGLRF